MENYIDIKGFEGYYQVSNLGNVKSLIKNKILKADICGSFYYRVNLLGKKYYIHRLVAENFIEKKEGYNNVNHKNGIKTDNTLGNLEWCNIRENTSHNYLNKDKTSKYVGVHFRNDSNKWRASIRVDGKLVDLGTYKNELDASISYQKYLIENRIVNKYGNVYKS